MKSAPAERKYPAPVPECFEAEAELTAGEFKAQAHITRRGFGDITLDFTSPQSLAPLTVSIGEGGFSLKYNNLTYSGEVPESLSVKELLGIFDKTVDLDSVRVTKDGGGWKYSGEISGRKFELLQSNENGLPVSVSLPEAGAALTLSEVKITKQ